VYGVSDLVMVASTELVTSHRSSTGTVQLNPASQVMVEQGEELVTLVEKPICNTQFLCDGCPLRPDGDSGATARVLLAVQNDVYTTGVMLQS
jgi:hypothetical protein